MSPRLSILVGLLGSILMFAACDSGKKEAGTKSKAAESKSDELESGAAKAGNAKAGPQALAEPEAKADEAKSAVADGATDSPTAAVTAGSGGVEIGAKAEPTGPVIEDGELSLSAEGIGELHLGMKSTEVATLLGKPAKKSKTTEEAATGDFVQDWEYLDQGLSLGMAGGSAKGPFSLSTITAQPDCTLPARWGLQIGSTRAAVEKVYGKHFDPDFTSAEQFVAGSVYGGVFFDFVDGKVSRIFIGAGAE